MFQIGEFSRLGQVSTRMLRHYDKLGLLVPNHTDEWTSYRYYTLEQLSRLHRIIALKDLGFSLQEIGNLLQKEAGPSVAELRGMLLLKQAEVRQSLAESRWQLKQIEARLQRLEEEGQPSPYEIVVKPVPETAVAAVRTTVPHIHEMGHYCEMLAGQVYAGLKKAGIRPLQPELILYHTEEYRETDLEVETAVAVHPKFLSNQPIDKKIRFRQLPGYELAASLIYEGALSEIIPAVLALLRWVGLHQHVPVGPLREIHLSGPVHGANVVEDELVTELQLPIALIAQKAE
jgi:DNA-binding transcriptional MerR regulator